MHLGQFLRQLTRLAEEFGIAVVITNQVSGAGALTARMHTMTVLAPLIPLIYNTTSPLWWCRWWPTRTA